MSTSAPPSSFYPPSSHLPLPSLPSLVLTLLVLPSFLGLGSPWTNNGVQASALPESRSQRLHQRQTIAEQSIPASEYSWSGEGDGSDICVRWSHQSAVVKGDLWIFGGQSKTSPDSEMGNWSEYPPLVCKTPIARLTRRR